MASIQNNGEEILPKKKELIRLSKQFAREIESAYVAYKKGARNNGSLSYIPTPFSPNPFVLGGELFHVFIFGGTFVREALCKKMNKSGNIFTFIRKPKTSRLSHIHSKKEFISYLEKKIDVRVDKIVLGIASALAPVLRDGRMDGKLLEISSEKAFGARDLIGKWVGKEVENSLYSKTGRKIFVSVVNDGICLQSSVLKKFQSKRLAFGIVGTGINFGFVGGNNIINLESSEFDALQPSAVGQKLARIRTGSPFGRETNGTFLFLHYNAYVKNHGLAFEPVHSTEELTSLARSKKPGSKIAQLFFQRSASLVACQLAGIAQFVHDDVVCVMEGGLFWKGYRYRKLFLTALRTLTPCRIQIQKVRNAEIVGAANLAV